MIESLGGKIYTHGEIPYEVDALPKLHSGQISIFVNIKGLILVLKSVPGGWDSICKTLIHNTYVTRSLHCPPSVWLMNTEILPQDR